MGASQMNGNNFNLNFSKLNLTIIENNTS